MNKFFLLLLVALSSVMYADALYSKNSKANDLYKKGEYQKALSLYDEALLESPEEKKLHNNKGSVYFRLNEFDKAIESYQAAQSIDDQDSRMAALYNQGNAYNLQGDKLLQSGDQNAMNAFTSARDSYIKALQLNPKDIDAKWNLQITQEKIKQLKQQQQQQQQNEKNKDKNKDNDQNKDNKQENKNQDNQDNQNKEQQQQNQQQEQKNQEQNQENQKNNPNEQKQEEKQAADQQKQDMQQQQALQLIQQYADDDKQLNKPQKKMRVGKDKKPGKDW